MYHLPPPQQTFPDDDSYSYSYSDSEYSGDDMPPGAPGAYVQPPMAYMANYWGGYDPYGVRRAADELEPAPGVFDERPGTPGRDPYLGQRGPPPSGYAQMGAYMQMYSQGHPNVASAYSMPPPGFGHPEMGGWADGKGDWHYQDKGKGKKGDGKGKKGGKSAEGKDGKGGKKGKGKGKDGKAKSPGALDHQQRLFYKTRICPFFGDGKCRHGAECTYAHSEEELRKAPNVAKTALCKDFAETGTCSMGDSCDFAHGWQEVRAYKTTLCKSHQAKPGSCPHGERCRFAHGHHELRDRPEDLPSEMLLSKDE